MKENFYKWILFLLIVINVFLGSYIFYYKLIINDDKKISNEQFLLQVNNIIENKEYNEYAIKIINLIVPDLREVLKDEQILKIFNDINEISINPYDESNPTLAQELRAYNGGDKIVINCFENELDNDNNLEGLKWLLTHEMTHSLGEFEVYTNDEEINKKLSATASRILEEGLADELASHVKGIEKIDSFGVKKQEELRMYEVDSKKLKVNNSFNNHTYTLGGNFLNLFKYIGCYEEIIDANYSGSFENLKTCFYKNVLNAEKYYDKLFYQMNLIFEYVSYPNSFLTKEDVLLYTKHTSYYEKLKETTLNDLLIEYSKLSASIINNKTNKTYSICEIKRKNAIYYSYDSNNFISDLNCKE